MNLRSSMTRKGCVVFAVLLVAGGVHVIATTIDCCDVYQEDELEATTPQDDAHFGHSVAIDITNGADIIVGEPLWESGLYTDIGRVHFFDRDALGWNANGSADCPHISDEDEFGKSVSLNEGLAIAGAHKHSHSYTEDGAAFVFELSGGSWGAGTELLASNAGANDHFGKAVAACGYSDTVIVGATGVDAGAPDTNEGSAYIFEKKLAGWTEIKELEPSGVTSSDHFGAAVAIYRDWAVVGRPDYQNGWVHVFKRD
jgi:hypothetical protein